MPTDKQRLDHLEKLYRDGDDGPITACDGEFFVSGMLSGPMKPTLRLAIDESIKEFAKVGE